MLKSQTLILKRMSSQLPSFVSPSPLVLLAIAALIVANSAAAQSEGEPSYETDPNYGSESGSDPYGSDPYGGGGANADVTQAVDGGILTALGSLDFSTLMAPATAEPLPTGPILLGQAEKAFASGFQQLAMDLYHGHMVVESPDAKQAFANLRLSRMLGRPLWQIRWGTSMAVRLDGVTDPKPLTASARPAGGNTGYDDGSGDLGADYEAEMRASMSRDGRPAAPGADTAVVPQTNVRELMETNLGLVATMISDEFGKRFQSGAFGLGLSSLQPPVAEPVAAAANSNLAQSSQDAEYEQQMREQEEQMREAAMQEGSGSEFGGFGVGGNGRAAPPAPISIGPAPLVPPSDALPMWVPGIVYVGEGRSDETLVKAKEEGIDLLLHFDILARKGRGDEVKHTSRCRIFQVSTGKSIVVSKAIDSDDAFQLTRTGRGSNSDYVAEQLSTMWSLVDREMTVVAMPQLTSDMAKKRVGSLVTSLPKRPLEALAEIRSYESAGLLSPEDVTLAFDLIAGEDAMKCLFAPIEERRQIIRDWATD